MIKEITNNEIELINNLIDYKITSNSFEKCFKYEINNEIVGIIDFSKIYERKQEIIPCSILNSINFLIEKSFIQIQEYI